MFFTVFLIDSGRFFIEIQPNQSKFYKIHRISTVGWAPSWEAKIMICYRSSTNFTEGLRELPETLSLRFVGPMDIFKDRRKQIFDYDPHFCAVALQKFPKS